MCFPHDSIELSFPPAALERLVLDCTLLTNAGLPLDQSLRRQVYCVVSPHFDDWFCARAALETLVLDSTLLTDGGLLALAPLAASLEEVCILDNPNVTFVHMLPAPFEHTNSTHTCGACCAVLPASMLAADCADPCAAAPRLQACRFAGR